jgi:hypothetical protein
MFFVDTERRRDCASTEPGTVFRAALLLVVVLASAACTPVRPWQRARLAHWSMSTDEQMSPGAAHANAVNEGATGGGSTAEGGCGCN